MFIVVLTIIGVIIIPIGYCLYKSDEWEEEEKLKKEAVAKESKELAEHELRRDIQKIRSKCEAKLTEDMTIAQVAGDSGVPVDLSIEREIKNIMNSFPILDFLNTIDWKYMGIDIDEDDSCRYSSDQRYRPLGYMTITSVEKEAEEKAKRMKEEEDRILAESHLMDEFPDLFRNVRNSRTSRFSTTSDLHYTAPVVIEYRIMADLLELRNKGLNSRIRIVADMYSESSKADTTVCVGFLAWNPEKKKEGYIYMKCPKQPVVHHSNDFAMVKLKDGNYAWVDKDTLAKLQSESVNNGEAGAEVIDLRGVKPQ